MRHVRIALPAAVLAALILTASTALAASATSAESDPLVEQIIEARKKTWRWQDVMQRTRTEPKFSGRELAAKSEAFKERVLAIWSKRARRTALAAKEPPHEREFRCIHRYEGPWDANTGNGYYGGLQMDKTFQRQYGPRLVRRKGLAHRWTPMEQIWVGERARREGRGFYPWPTAARSCGLI